MKLCLKYSRLFFSDTVYLAEYYNTGYSDVLSIGWVCSSRLTACSLVFTINGLAACMMFRWMMMSMVVVVVVMLVIISRKFVVHVRLMRRICRCLLFQKTQLPFTHQWFSHQRWHSHVRASQTNVNIHISVVQTSILTFTYQCFTYQH